MLYKYEKKEIAIKATSLPSYKKKRNIINVGVSVLCFSAGLSILLYSLYPHINGLYLNLKGENSVSKSLLIPSASELPSNSAGFVQNTDGFSSNYISNVSRNFSVTNQLLNITPRTHPEYANIQGIMYLTVPKLGLNKTPIRINVDSFDEKSYLPLLDNSLAHFLGTSIPSKPGNTFIYGHSTNELWAKTDPTNPKYAFTFLNKLDIGDELTINYDGVDYRYSTQKINMVSPSDISPIYTTSEAKTLTMMTCWPPGIGAERLIVSARQVDNSN